MGFNHEMKKNRYRIPSELYYTKEHEWVKIESDGTAVVGITDYAQSSLHEIVYVDSLKEGTAVKQMEPLGTLESVKSVSEIFSPLSGIIAKTNQKLAESPELVNDSPYEDGWIATIKPTALEKEKKNLISPEQYAKYLDQATK